MDAGDTLRVADPGPEVRAAYRRALASAPRGSVPGGKRITYRGATVATWSSSWSTRSNLRRNATDPYRFHRRSTRTMPLSGI